MYSCLEGEAEHRPTFAKISKESKRNKWQVFKEDEWIRRAKCPYMVGQTTEKSKYQ